MKFIITIIVDYISLDNMYITMPLENIIEIIKDNIACIIYSCSRCKNNAAYLYYYAK